MNTSTTPPTPDTPSGTPTSAGTPQDPDLPRSPDTRDESALADEVFVDGDSTAPLPTTRAPAVGSGATAITAALATAPAATAPAATAPAATAPAVTTPPEPQWLTGPAPFALVLGLLGLLVAGSTLVNELTDVSLPWGDLGPWSVVAAGLVVLLVGAIGLRSSRARA